ncbi:MAG TPA: class I SAM-dependent methyltransferase [Telluria sp.]|nr:class I SAM-dependent methyltransferase [Telluria sp.]
MSDTAFVGSIPELYERYMVPMIFAPYARDMAARVAAAKPAAVLETAAGTGVLTRALAAELPPEAELTATDLNQAMLDEARRRLPERAVRWQQADALALPFEDGAFDVVACQFGAMFFPDKPAAYAEARRLLREDGRFFFSVWDRIEENHFVHVIQRELDALFPEEPPRFMPRIPHGYFDGEQIAAQLRAGGFTAAPRIEPLAFTARAPSAHDAAFGYCQGTPLRAELERLGPDALARATDAAAAALRRRYGDGPIEGQIRAWVVEAAR